ncbi:MAG: MEDS domain-containing protein [Gemmatimonadales bacterium]
MSEADELLDIEQAARFLNVSETSLRRWTNAGRLACLRIGRRRERRFRRSDLLAFMEDQPATSQAQVPRSSAVARMVIRGVSYTFGSHLCGLCGSEVGRIRQVVGFLEDGLRADAVCYYTAPEEAWAEVLTHLEKIRPSLPADVAAGRLVLSSYIPSSNGQLEYWDTNMRAAMRAGARFLRVVGDLRGLGPTVSAEELFEYEAGYQESIATRFPLVTLCQYDVRQFSSLTVFDALKFHRDTFRYPPDVWLA